MTVLDGSDAADLDSPPWDRLFLPPFADTGDVLWMLDLDEDGNPILAHQIVAKEHRKLAEHTRSGEIRRWAGEVRTAACGREVTAESPPEGWQSTKAGDTPLDWRWVHCGDAQPVEGVKP